jgi:hypothetical protein
MTNEPLRRTRPRPVPVDPDRPKIWAEGEQRPPFSFRGLRRATFNLARDAAAPLNAWAARTMRRAAVRVADGAGRIPAGKLGRAERFVPSHLRVAGWIKNSAAVLAHASAVADPDVARGNALVAEIEPHLWPRVAEQVPPEPDLEIVEPAASPFGADAPPVVLAEPLPPGQEPDPFAAIRDDLDGTAVPAGKERKPVPHASSGPAQPPAPPGPVATTAIQMTGYLLGWATVILALPFGLVRALWLWMARNVDLRRVGLDD